MALLKKEFTPAITSFKNADDRAKSDVKSEFASRQSAITQELDRFKKDLHTLRIERDHLTAQVFNLAVERDRPVLHLANLDADRDRLERENTELKTDRDQDIHSNDSLFTRLAEVVSSVSAGALLLPAVSPRKASRPRQQRSAPSSSTLDVLTFRKTLPTQKKRSAPVSSKPD